MNKDKEWLLRELKKIPHEFQDGYLKVNAINILPLIDQLDEQEKVIIPQFAADEFEYKKRTCHQVDEAKDIPLTLQIAFENPGIDDFLDWVRENPEDYVMAVRNGYEIEKEPLYYVKFIDDNEMSYLNQSNESSYIFISIVTSLFNNKTQFTEKEIKSINERYWQFAKPVEETL